MTASTRSSTSPVSTSIWYCMAFAQLTWRELARYRGLPVCTQYEALSSRYSRECSAQHSCQRQRNARLAHILRLRPTPDRDRSTALCRGTARHRVEGHGLRTRLDYNRSVPFGVFLGTLASDESRCEAFTRCSICVVAFPRLSSSATASSTTSTSSTTSCPSLVPSFQMDQTAPANHGLLRHNRERS